MCMCICMCICMCMCTRRLLCGGLGWGDDAGVGLCDALRFAHARPRVEALEVLFQDEELRVTRRRRGGPVTIAERWMFLGYF